MGARKPGPSPTYCRRINSDDANCGPDTTDELCSCRRAVTRCYRGMLESGEAPNVALEVATRVYCYHHPEADHGHAHMTVEAWVQSATLH